MEAMFGAKLLSNADGTLVDTASSFGDEIKLIGIYFSAHWCPPCKGFTPRLAEFYNEINAYEKKLEIVFVTRDRDNKSFLDYFKEMPWLAIPFDEEKRNELCETHDVRGIPCLVFIKKDGTVETKDGRTRVMQHLEGKEEFTL